MLVDANGVGMISLSNGSQINVTDLLRLSTASKINVVKGPLVAVDGVGSALNASGALVNFNNTSGNQIIVNNPQAGNASRGGPANNQFPVFISGAGSDVSIGANPVKNNPAVNPSTINVTGALIHATNGGKVTITAP
jgi:hypothetical protein